MSHTGFGYQAEPVGTTSVEVVWSGSYASRLRVVPKDADVIVTLNPDRLDHDHQLVFPLSKTPDTGGLTMEGLDFCGFTVHRPVATSFQAWWS